MKQVALLCLIAATALAEDRLIVASSSSSGTYHAMLTEVDEFCSGEDTGLTVTELPPKGGATDNLDALANNRASAAFLHSDVIYAAAMAEPKYKELKTLVNLYPEEIHVVALRTLRVGSMFNKQDATTLTDLKGLKVAAAGGGCITARLLTGQGEGGFEVVCKDSGKEVIPAIESGEVQAGIFVGGAPLSNIEALNGNKFKLLSINDTIGSRLTSVYRTASVNYANLKSGTVRTLAPSAILVTRKYTRPAMVAPQAKFRACFYAHLDDLKETPGKHPKWQQVDPSDHGVWDWYEIPSTVTGAATTPATTGAAPSRRR